MIGNYHKAEMLGVTTETFKKKSVHKVSRHRESCPTQTRLVLEHFHVTRNFAAITQYK